MLKWLVVPNQRCHIDRDVGVVVNQRFTETGCGSPHRFEKHKCAGHGCGRAVITVVDFRHQNSAPNCSQLGVFISASRKSRGDRAHSACASHPRHERPNSPGLPLFCPIFSRNLRQPLRRGTRRRRCSSATYACADGNGWLAGLHEHSRTANPRGQPPRQPLGGNGSSP